jgi:hypothetical protein
MRMTFPRFTTAAVIGTVAVAGLVLSATTTRTMASDRVTSSATAEAAPAPEPAARYREITLPAGTVLPLTLDSHVASDSSRVEDDVRAHLRRAIVVDGVTVVPAGSSVVGDVTSLARPGRVKGRGHIAFRFRGLTTESNGRSTIRTSSVSRLAPATKRQDAAKIGLPAAGGAVIGAITGGKKGAAIGAAAGGGAGTAVVLSTRGREVRLGPGAAVSVRLLEPVTLRVRS